MNSSVPDGDGSPVYTKDVHTPQVARQPQCKLDFQVDSRQALSEHAYNIQQSQRYIEEEHSVHLCTHVVKRAQFVVHIRRVYTEVHHQFVHKYKIFGNAGKPSSRAALCLDQVSNVHGHFIDLC